MGETINLCGFNWVGPSDGRGAPIKGDVSTYLGPKGNSTAHVCYEGPKADGYKWKIKANEWSALLASIHHHRTKRHQ